MDYFEEVKRELAKYRPLGEERSENGTLLIGRAQHVAKLAWLHSIYPTLNKNEINELVKELNTDIPQVYKEFLMKASNGLTMFVSKFYLYGLRKQLGRSIEASRQPFSPIIANVAERPNNTKESYFFIGGYSWDGSKMYIDKITNEVHYCDRWNATSLHKWESFEDMLVAEVKRLCSLFDENGIIKDKEKPTTPIERPMA